jgi:hypothetical protein
MGTLPLKVEVNKEHHYYNLMIYLYEVVQYGETNIEGKTRRGSLLNIYIFIYVE